MGFRRVDTPLDGLILIQPDVFSDSRGHFLELFNTEAFREIGLGHLQFVQDNLSWSTHGVIRGMHFQRPPHAQGKLVTALTGAVLDAVVDLRRASPTYGQSYSIELRAETRQMLYIPEGFAHGFQVLTEHCSFLYKCTAFYDRASDGGIAWDDPALGIPWRDLPQVVSDKDRQHPLLAAFETPF